MLRRRAEQILNAYSTALRHDNKSLASSSRAISFSARRLASSKSATASNHYATLGVARDASPKEIKAAFYELSKKYHPDVNVKETPEKSAKLFQNVVDAYEILGSPEKKKFYDLSLRKEKPTMSMRAQYSAPSSTAVRSEPPKSYTDLDIDYKDFQHFQQSNRRRRVYQSDPSGYDDYLKSLGLSDQHKRGANGGEPQYTYKDSRAYKREQEELRLAAEMEELNRRSRYPLPTFEQLAREKAKIEKRSETLISKIIVLVTSGALLLVISAYCAGPSTSTSRRMSGKE